MSRASFSFALAAAFLGACSSSSAKSAQLGGDTHWLAACEAHDDCDRGSCICGVCSESCEGDGQCDGPREAACYETDSPGVSSHCASGPPDHDVGSGICLAACGSDGDCADLLRCHAGACVNDRERPKTDAGAPDATPPVVERPGRPATSASDFAQLQPEVDFDGPTAFHDPMRVFEGPAESLLGSWQQVDCPGADFYAGCLQLEIARAGDGEITGRAWLHHSSSAPPPEAFPPPTDLEVGYPAGWSPAQYRDLLWNEIPMVYTMLDARVDGEQLRFWFSTLEPWAEWCALQTSYPIAGGTPPYQCVPEGAARGEVEVDPGKLVLCTAATSAGYCEVFGEPVEVPCNCTLAPDNIDRSLPQCSIAYCHCDAAGCRPNWHAQRYAVAAEVQGDEMVITEWYDMASPLPFSLQRVGQP